MQTVMAGQDAQTALREQHDALLPKMPEGTHDTSSCPFCTVPAETAAAKGAGMAGEGGTPSATVDLNDPAIQAIVNHRVTEQTAALTERASAAETARDEAQRRIDVLEAEKSALEQRATTAENELASAREAAQEAEQAASRREGRKAALREVAAHLTDDWFAQEVAHGDKKVARLDKIALMTDDDFESYKGELASAFEGVTVAPAQGGGTSTTQSAPPRETAMQTTGGTSPAGAGTGSKASTFLKGVSAYGGRR